MNWTCLAVFSGYQPRPVVSRGFYLFVPSMVVSCYLYLVFSKASLGDILSLSSSQSSYYIPLIFVSSLRLTTFFFKGNGSLSSSTLQYLVFWQ